MIFLGEPCTTNLTVWNDNNISNQIVIKAQHLTELRNAVNREVLRRSKPSLTWSQSINQNDVQFANSWDEYFSKINIIRSTMNVNPVQPQFQWSYTNVASGNYILAARLIELRAKMNDLEDDCICNCNHCPCNCNHCACNCNHSPCPCNCNHSPCSCDCNYYPCSCDCNYSCTCNCNHKCTCNCNYACTCNCNYRCTCNCAYSDKKLKCNIVYF